MWNLNFVFFSTEEKKCKNKLFIFDSQTTRVLYEREVDEVTNNTSLPSKEQIIWCYNYTLVTVLGFDNCVVIIHKKINFVKIPITWIRPL